MFQHTRSRHNALFRHMTDDKDCHTQSFCELHQDAGALSYLADTARCGTCRLDKHGLDRVDHDHIRAYLPDHLRDRIQVRLTQERKWSVHRPDPACPQFDLF